MVGVGQSGLSRGALAAVGAFVIVLVGVVPMTLAAANPNADPIVSEALNGTPNVIDMPAPAFSLVNQRGVPVSLSSLRGHTLALTFSTPCAPRTVLSLPRSSARPTSVWGQ